MNYLQRRVTDLRDYYRDKVKPCFESGSGKASTYMFNLAMHLDELGPEIRIYHSSLRSNERATAIVQDNLRQGKVPPKEVLEEFEGFLNGLVLSTKTGNTG